MHCLDTLRRVNAEWPHPQTPHERREAAIQQLEHRIGVAIDRDDPMLGAMARMEASLWAR